MVVPPLSPAEVGSMLKLDAADALDARLITGELPLIYAEWQPGQTICETDEWCPPARPSSKKPSEAGTGWRTLT